MRAKRTKNKPFLAKKNNLRNTSISTKTNNSLKRPIVRKVVKIKRQFIDMTIRARDFK